MPVDDGAVVVMQADSLTELIEVLRQSGYDTRGPVVRDGAIVPGPVSSVADLPVGCHDEQGPGSYRLRQTDDRSLFGWAVGPGSWKAGFFPPTQELWRARVDQEGVSFAEPPGRVDDPMPVAIVGARPCEVAAVSVLDRVLGQGSAPDPDYARRRDGAFVVVVECGAPASTCFCTSMRTGPQAEDQFDLALTELDDAAGHRFLVRVGTERGRTIMSRVAEGAQCRTASAEDLEARGQVLARSESRITRRLETGGLAELLERNIDHPRWDDVAERCVACGNCTLVCPTCFCSDVHDTTDVDGEVRRERVWSSCFDLDHSYLHGGPVRTSNSSRYRQWLTHKLSTWWDQFGTSGCIGCGRCIAWCPVGIDLTEEAAAIRAHDGAVRVGSPTGRRPS